jgi:starch synthase
MSKLRVLLIAEACNPEWTSVPLVGWSHASALRELADVHIVTQVRNQEAIERAGLREGREFTALDSEPVARPLYQATNAIRKATGLGWTFETAMQVVPYYYWEDLFWKRFGAEIEARRWDIVHRLTPLSPTTPSIAVTRVARAGVPFVWGPINGGVPWPEGFSHVQKREGEWLHYVRDAYKLMPGYRATLNHTTAILAGSQATLSQLPESTRRKTVYLPENAIDEARFGTARSGPVSSPLRVAFVGRLVAYKGADMLIEASAELLRAGKLSLDIIGDGPEREPLKALAAQLGVSSAVKLDGWVSHKELSARLLESDVFGFPSVREFGGGVVLEAMALGLVPVVADYAGPAELVTPDTGFLVPIAPRAELIASFRKVLEGLVAEPSQLRAIGERARKRVLSSFTWPVKAQQTMEVYRWVTGQRDKPNFGMPLP